MSNQNEGVPRTSVEDFAAYDRLPPQLKRLVAHAPYDMDSVGVLQRAKQCRSTDEACRVFVEAVFALRDASLRKTYGPDHPMIGDRARGRRHAA